MGRKKRYGSPNNGQLKPGTELLCIKNFYGRFERFTEGEKYYITDDGPVNYITLLGNENFKMAVAYINKDGSVRITNYFKEYFKKTGKVKKIYKKMSLF